MDKARIFGLSLVTAMALTGLGASTAAAGVPEEALAQEALVESSEEATETVEEAAAVATDEFAAKHLAAYSREIGRWKFLVKKVRMIKHELRALPLTSTRRLERLPVKRARLHEYRQHLKSLRLDVEAKELALGLT